MLPYSDQRTTHSIMCLLALVLSRGVRHRDSYIMHDEAEEREVRGGAPAATGQ